MAPEKRAWPAPKSLTQPSFILNNHPASIPISYEPFKAYVSQQCQATEKPASGSAPALRHRNSTLSPDISDPSTKHVASAPPLLQTCMPPSKRPHKKKPTESPPLYIGCNNSKYGDGPFVTVDDKPEMPTYRVITLARTDAEATFVYRRKGELEGVSLPNEPIDELQDRRPKDDATKECAFYHKIDPQSMQCVDWRRKLGGWLTDCVGRADGNRYILGAFPEGYVMWEHVRGIWVLPNDPNTSVDPTKLNIRAANVEVVSENAPDQAIDADARDDGANQFIMPDKPILPDDIDDANANIAANADAGSNIKVEVKSEFKVEDDAHYRNASAHQNVNINVAAAPDHASDRNPRDIHAAERPAANAFPADQQPQFRKRRDDIYLYGYKDNKRYAAPNEFFPHLLWLATAKIVGPKGQTEFPCTCHHCDPELEKERRANKIDRIDLAYKKWKEATERSKIVR